MRLPHGSLAALTSPRPAPPGHAQPLHQAWGLGTLPGLRCYSGGRPAPAPTWVSFLPTPQKRDLDGSFSEAAKEPSKEPSGQGRRAVRPRAPRCWRPPASWPLHQGRQRPPRGLRPRPAPPGAVPWALARQALHSQHLLCSGPSSRFLLIQGTRFPPASEWPLGIYSFLVSLPRPHGNICPPSVCFPREPPALSRDPKNTCERSDRVNPPSAQQGRRGLGRGQERHSEEGQRGRGAAREWAGERRV